MTSATRVTVATFGALAGLAGIEHGIGEILQGNVAPEGLAILSWPRSEFFQILGGEPALTLIPSLLISGIVSIVASLIFMGWAALLADRRNGGLVLLLLSMAMLLVGAGFGPPLLGMIVGITATQINAPRAERRGHLAVNVLGFLGGLWPWSYAAAIVAWLALMPGLSLLDYAVGATSPISDSLVYAVILSAFGFLLLTIVTGLAHDRLAGLPLRQRQVHSPDE